MQYVVNGELFDDEEEAKQYEEKLKAKEEEKKKKDEEKEERLNELKELEKEYLEKAKKFYEDYGYYSVTLKGFPCSFDNFFDDFDMFK